MAFPSELPSGEVPSSERVQHTYGGRLTSPLTQQGAVYRHLQRTADIYDTLQARCTSICLRVIRVAYHLRGIIPGSPRSCLTRNFNMYGRRRIRKRTISSLGAWQGEVMIQKWNMASALAPTCTDHLTYIIGNSRSAGGLRFGLLPIAIGALTASRDV